MKRLMCIVVSIMMCFSMIIQAKADTDIFAGVVIEDDYKKVTFYVREKIDYGNKISYDTDINRAMPASSKKAYSQANEYSFTNMVNFNKSYSVNRLSDPWYGENGEYNEGVVGEGPLLPGVSIELKINDNIGYQLLGVTDSEGKVETYLAIGTYEFKAYKAGYKTEKGEVDIISGVKKVNVHIAMEKLEPTTEPSTEEPTTAEPSTEEPTTAEPSTEEPTTAEPSTEDTKPTESTTETESSTESTDNTKPNGTESTDNTKPSGTESTDNTKPSDTESTDNTNPNATNPTETTTSGPGPHTGDNTPMNVFMYILIGALAIILFIVVKQDKDDKEKNENK